MAVVQKLVSKDSFVNGRLVPAGHLASYDEAQLSGKERHIKDVGDFSPAMVQIAPIAPTGPNPTVPQQLPPDAVQMPGGGYAQPGKMLVAEVTVPGEERKAQVEGGKEADVTKALEKAMKPVGGQNDDDELVAGTVADVTATLGEKTDDELEALRAAELDREKPRKGVTDAIKAELDKRSA